MIVFLFLKHVSNANPMCSVAADGWVFASRIVNVQIQMLFYIRLSLVNIAINAVSHV